jgi:hypothetical protein
MINKLNSREKYKQELQETLHLFYILDILI